VLIAAETRKWWTVAAMAFPLLLLTVDFFGITVAQRRGKCRRRAGPRPESRHRRKLGQVGGRPRQTYGSGAARAVSWRSTRAESGWPATRGDPP